MGEAQKHLKVQPQQGDHSIQRWQRLDLERIDDTSLGEGKRLRYQGFKHFIKKNPADYVSIKDNGHHVCYTCYAHRHMMMAILSEVWSLPAENYTYDTLKTVDNKTGVTLMHPDLECVLCETNAESKKEE